MNLVSLPSIPLPSSSFFGLPELRALRQSAAGRTGQNTEPRFRITGLAAYGMPLVE
jgi:hypothetical protein